MSFTTPSIMWPIIGLTFGIFIIVLSILLRMFGYKHNFQLFFGFVLVILNIFGLGVNLKGTTTITTKQFSGSDPKTKTLQISLEKTKK